ncbi:MAG TPA: carboxylesterase family protein [Candidatus Sulfotelmatobacter sp.]
MRLGLAILCCGVAFARAYSQTDSHPVVTIDSGMLVGAHFGTAPSEGMFLGIPYAAAPVGERRLQAPDACREMAGGAPGGFLWRGVSAGGA